MQVAVWCVIGYVLYAAACFALESYARHRFSVQREAEIQLLQGRRDRLMAETRRATSLAEMKEWLPYQMMVFGSVTVGCAAALMVGFLVIRALLRSRRKSGLFVPLRFLAIGVFVPAAAVLLLAVLPPVMAGILWETQNWLLWPSG